jgi:hypothetical protein
MTATSTVGGRQGVRRMRRSLAGFAVVTVVVLVGVGSARGAHGPGDVLDARHQLYASAYAWSDQRQVLRVTTIDAAGRRQERVIELYERRYRDGSRKALLVFAAPDNVKGTAVLSQERARGIPERWLYLPRQKRARRFAGQMRDEGLLGTDLTAGELDLMRDTLSWTTAALRPKVRGPERVAGVATYALDIGKAALAPLPAAAEYERVVLWIGTEDLVLRQLELYGAPATPLKRILQRDVRFVGRVPVPARIEVENPAAGTRSVFELVEAGFDVGFPDDVFSLPLLASPKRN